MESGAGDIHYGQLRVRPPGWFSDDELWVSWKPRSSRSAKWHGANFAIKPEDAIVLRDFLLQLFPPPWLLKLREQLNLILAAHDSEDESEDLGDD
jgi:hypothetical protein